MYYEGKNEEVIDSNTRLIGSSSLLLIVRPPPIGLFIKRPNFCIYSSSRLSVFEQYT